MSNRVTIEPTKFENVRSGSVTYGVRVYDDFGQAYDNTWESIPDDDLEVLERLLQSDDTNISDTLDFVLEHELGIYIGGEFYSWDSIQHLWEKD